MMETPTSSSEFRIVFLRLFNKYMRMGYDSTQARYLAYKHLVFDTKIKVNKSTH